jgi:hypothetical protein
LPRDLGEVAFPESASDPYTRIPGLHAGHSGRVLSIQGLSLGIENETVSLEKGLSSCQVLVKDQSGTSEALAIRGVGFFRESNGARSRVFYPKLSGRPARELPVKVANPREGRGNYIIAQPRFSQNGFRFGSLHRKIP